MGNTPDLLNLFQTPAVTLLYYMAVVIVSYAAFFMALELRARHRRENGAGRYAVAAAGVAIAWMLLMLGAMATLLTRGSPVAIIPPLERAISVIVLLLSAWAFATADARNPRPKPAKRDADAEELVRRPRRRRESAKPPTDLPATVLLVISVAVTLLGYVATALNWGQRAGVAAGTTFTESPYNFYWLIALVAVCVFSILIMLRGFARIADTPLKAIFFLPVLISAGYGLYAYSTGNISGSDPGVMRLGFLAALPILPVIVYRFVTARMRAIAAENARQAAETAAQTALNNVIADNLAERDSASVIKILGAILEREQAEDLPQQIAVAVVGALRADLAALYTLTDEQFADGVGAYDNINRRPITAIALNRSEQPALQGSIASKKQVLLTTEKNLNELVDLYTRLDIQQVGPAYLQPLSKDGRVIGVLIIALPFTRRLLKESEARLLEALAPVAARLILIARSTAQRRAADGDRMIRDMVENDALPGDLPTGEVRTEMQSMMSSARDQINDLNARVRNLQIELDYERARMMDLGLSINDPDGISLTQQLEAIQRERMQLENERESLVDSLKDAQNQLLFSTSEGQEILDQTISTLTRDRDDLQNQKAQLEAELSRLRAVSGTAAPGVLRELLSQLTDDRARLELERDTVRQQLNDAEAQLSALGIEGGAAGVVTTVVQLMDERSRYKVLLEKIQEEKAALLEERQRGISPLSETERDQRIAALENELRRVAETNEVLIRQRDALRNEKDATRDDNDHLEAQRAGMVAELSNLQVELESATFERNRALSEQNRMMAERAKLQAQRDQLVAERMALITERDQLTARIEGNRETLQQLGNDSIGTLQGVIGELSTERADLDARYQAAARDLERAEAEINRLQGQLARSVQVPNSVAVDSGTAEVMLSIAQELRTPMSAIGAYTDLLLGESTGILGALQRQFMQRIKSNADRLAGLIQDFVRITALDTGQFRIRPEEIDMDDVIDDAITSTRVQFRERGITLRLDRPDRLPSLRGDRDSLQQIVLNLLSNAYLASPPDSEVGVSVQVKHEFLLPQVTQSQQKPGRIEKQDVLLLSVTDLGGGIPTEEQARVFSRLYRADNPLIQGVGDTGVGLSIARALTEMHAGKIWLESATGKSSTFFVALPLHGTQEVSQVNDYATAT